MVLPFILPILMDRIGLRHTTSLFALSCLVGQWGFIAGLEHKSYTMCLVSRLVFGISDCMSIAQQTIMCMWFTNDQLPLAYSLLLFQIKMVRALSDNLASIVYNSTRDITSFFYVGLGVSAFSSVCTVVLMHIHKTVIESQGNAVLQGADARKLPKILVRNGSDPKNKLPLEIWVLTLSYTVGFAAIHSFYPNMSKFL